MSAKGRVEEVEVAVSISSKMKRGSSVHGAKENLEA